MRMSIAESQKRSVKGFNLKEDDRAWRPSKCYYSITLCLVLWLLIRRLFPCDGVSADLFPGMAF